MVINNDVRNQFFLFFLFPEKRKKKNNKNKQKNKKNKKTKNSSLCLLKTENTYWNYQIELAF